MTSEQWQALDHLFHSALERPAAERPAFLDKACAGDSSLREQIEALLAAHEAAGSFIESPALEIEARSLTNERSLIGESISHYRIISRLGEGGMGIVFLAHDVLLSRKVALKLLPDYLTSDIGRLRRFEQEARLASALSHPNILTIHEIGHSGATHFIASEYIEGRTLRNHMAAKRLGLDEVLDIALQVASALTAAHAKGIVHRDIKPENIMVLEDNPLLNRRHYIKVLDFGIGKLTETEGSNTEVLTRPLVNTGQGMALGTAPYMSPEQAQGLDVDTRTDIWSLGVLLYEMLTGQLPFEGPTISHAIVSILEREPVTVRTLSPEVPESVERIVNKALRKDRNERQQTAREILAELEGAKRESDFESGATTAGGALMRPAQSTDGKKQTDGAPAEGTAPISRADTSSTGGYLLDRLKHNQRAILFILSALVLAGVGTIALKEVWRNRFANRAEPFSKIKVTRITTTGHATHAAVSPDGKYVVHVVGKGSDQSLWLRHIETGSDTQIVPANGNQLGTSTFSPDGNYIYFIRNDDTGYSLLHRVPVLGGQPQTLVRDIDTTVAISPDSKRLAFIRGDPNNAVASLVVANSDGTGEEKLVTHPMEDIFSATTSNPAWSPDGEKIAYARNSGSAYYNIVTVDLETRVEKKITSQEWHAIQAISWLPDGGGLIVTADEEERKNTQIWYASYPGGEVRPITSDLNNYRNVSLTADAHSLVSVMEEGTSDIWIAPSGDANRATHLSSGSFDGVAGIDWTPDGRIVHVSRASGDADIWIMKSDGTDDRQLTAKSGLNVFPSVSWDGHYIVFMSNRKASGSRARTWSIWRMNIDGSDQTQLTRDALDSDPLCTVDGQWVIYTSRGADKLKTMKVPIQGGSPTKVSAALDSALASALSVSPVGENLAFRFLDRGTQPPRLRTGVFPLSGGGLIAQFDFPIFFGTIGPGFFGQRIEWTGDGRALTYIKTDNEVSNIWKQRIDGSPPTQMTYFKSDLIFNYKWSRDGKQLAVARGSQVRDIVLIRDLGDQR